MKTLRNYVLKEFVSPFVLSLSVLLFIFSLIFLTQYTNLIINKGVMIASVGKLFFYSLFYPLSYIMPLTIFVSALWSLGRISADNEIVTIRASGINIIRVTMPLIVLGLLFSMFMIIFNGRLMPRANFERRKALVDIGINNPTATLEAGTFIDSFQKYILFVYKIDGNKLQNIRIYEPQGPGKPARTIIAQKGEFISMPDKGLIKLKLMNGSSDEPNPNNPNAFYKLNFKTYFMNLNIAKAKQGKVSKKPKDMTFKELSSEIERIHLTGIDPTPLQTEIHKKISLAFACFALILVACPLGIMTRQRLKSVNLGRALLIFGGYYLLILGAEALSLQGYLAPQIAMWLPNAILGVLGLILTLRICVF